jgi:type II secretory pathway predicted ATPase ExeA/pSer/pThr/pTyr-binding forkhead associated (FHA) protein
MELAAAGLKEQPFRTHGRPVVFVPHAAQEKAFAFLSETCTKNTGLGLFQGPSLSGKTTIIRQFAEQQKSRSAVAVIDGSGLNTTAFLETVLREFGYEYKFDTVNELLSMLKVFIQHQTVSGRPPLLIIENINEVNPSALRVLCELATIRVKEKFAIRIVLASDRSIDYIVKASAMECMSKRLTGNYHLEPLTMDETSDYLYAKLRHGGCLDPENVFPENVCDELYRASGGWPGIVDRLALLAIANAKKCPVGLKNIEYPTIPSGTQSEQADEQGVARRNRKAEPPMLRLTHNGKTIQQTAFDGSRLLIGRSEHNDIQIESAFISRHHMLLVRRGAATLLMDLNSANGTYVNAWRVSNQMLADGDLITLGEHGIQFVDKNAPTRVAIEGAGFDDTLITEALSEMGRVLEQDETALMPERNGRPEFSGDSA